MIDLASQVTIQSEIYHNSIASQFTHMLLSFSLKLPQFSKEEIEVTADQLSDTEIQSNPRQMFHRIVYSFLKFLINPTLKLLVKAPFDQILPHYSLSTSHIYSFTLLILFSKQFTLNYWKGELRSNNSPVPIENLRLMCQFPVHSLHTFDIEIIDENSISFLRFLNGIRYHHYSLESNHHHQTQSHSDENIEHKESNSNINETDRLINNNDENINNNENENDHDNNLNNNNNNNNINLNNLGEESTTTPTKTTINVPVINSDILLSYIKQFGNQSNLVNQTEQVDSNNNVSTTNNNSSENLNYTFGYHGTNYYPNIQSILENGYNPLLRNAQLFGPGEYFTQAKFEDYASLYSGSTNILILNALIISKELYPHNMSEFNQTPYYVIPNPNPKLYGMTERSQSLADYFSYSLPLLLVQWKKYSANRPSKSSDNSNTLTSIEEENLDQESIENLTFDYNHHKDPNELRLSFQSLQPNRSGGLNRMNSDTNQSDSIWTTSNLTEEDSSLYFGNSPRVNGLSHPQDVDSIQLNNNNNEPENETTTQQPKKNPPAARLVLSSSYSFNFDDDENNQDNDGHSNYHTNHNTQNYSAINNTNSLKNSNLGNLGGEYGIDNSDLQSNPTQSNSSKYHTIKSSQKYSIDSRRSLSYCQEDDEEDRRYAVLKLKSLIKKQETFIENTPHLQSASLSRGLSNTWFDSIF